MKSSVLDSLQTQLNVGPDEDDRSREQIEDSKVKM